MPELFEGVSIIRSRIFSQQWPKYPHLHLKRFFTYKSFDFCVSQGIFFFFIFHFQGLIVLVCRKLTYHKMVNLIEAKLEIYQYLFPLASTCIWTMCICTYTHVHMHLHPCAHIVSYTCVPTHMNMWMYTWKIPRHTYRCIKKEQSINLMIEMKTKSVKQSSDCLKR